MTPTVTPTRKPLRPVPSPVEACEGGLLAAANSEALLRAAIAAGDVGSSGAAMGLGVLALEEAVKARALFAPLLSVRAGRRPTITETHLRRLLYGPQAHFYRHAMGTWQMILSSLTRPLWRGVGGSTLTGQDIEEIDQLMSGRELKESGFYVDFVDRAWRSPAAVTKERWLASRTFVERFVAETTEQAAKARAMLG